MEETFTYCRNLVNAPEIPFNVNIMSSTFQNCTNLTGDILIYSENITDATNCFYNTTLNKNVYILFHNNGINTSTYNAFINAGYSSSERINGALLMDIYNTYNNYDDWFYSDITKDIQAYLGTNTNLIIPTEINNTTVKTLSANFADSNIQTMDMSNIPLKNNDFSNVFSNCYNLTNVTNVNENVTKMDYTFKNCYNLTDFTLLPNNVNSLRGVFQNCYNLVNGPTEIPSSASQIPYAFYGCSNLVNVPAIPNSVINMYQTFYNCQKITETPVLPNYIANLCTTFAYCSNLTEAPVIPNSVNNIDYAFMGCTNLVNAPVISDNYYLTSLDGTFSGCSSIFDAPIIPNRITSLVSTFRYCTNMVNFPVIPYNVTNMRDTFHGCYKLIDMMEIPPYVTDMGETFRYCSNLTNASDIPNSVTNMYGTFQGCVNLSGDINIYSKDVADATDCFADTVLTKNVYIPYYYENGQVSMTYNAFTGAGYSATERVNGVQLLSLYGEEIPESGDDDFDGEVKSFVWDTDLSISETQSTNLTTVSTNGYDLSNVSEKIPSTYLDRNTLEHIYAGGIDYNLYVGFNFDVYGGKYKPQTLSFNISKNGTDKGSVAVGIILDGVETIIGDYPTIQRNNADPSYSNISININNLGLGYCTTSCIVRFYLYNQAANKTFSLWNVSVTGLLETAENNNA